MGKPTLINIVSGKGGTGKSLFCALLGRLLAQESAKVLLVDFDIFVRGLTHFYYTFIKEKRVLTKGVSVSDYLCLTDTNNNVSYSLQNKLSYEQFYEVHICPSVSQIESQVKYLEVTEELKQRLKRLLSLLRDTAYDIILIDNRSGVDHLILESCKHCDITISIAESDPISRTTNENLLRHLNTSSVGKVYTIFNKVRFLKTFDDYEKSMEQIRGDYTIIGQIPFDVDLFETFGSKHFWETANSTKYAYGVAEAWNSLSKRESFEVTIDMDRFKIFSIWPSNKKTPTFLSKFERMSLLFGIISIFTYFVYDLMEKDNFDMKSILLIYAVLFLLYPVFRRIIFQNKDKD